MPGGLLARYGLEQLPTTPVFPTDTFGDWLAALEDRYLEGIALAHERLDGGSAYLFGYVAEMYLKCAICEAIGLLPNDYVFDTALLSTAGNLVSITLQPKKLRTHDMRKLADLLKTVRAGSGNQLPLVLEAALDKSVAGIGQTGLVDDWSESLRYRSTAPFPAETARIVSAVEWLRENYQFLKG